MARWSLRRLKVWHLALAVAVAAFGCLFLRAAWRLVDEAVYGPYGLGIASGLLSPGQSVVLIGDHREGTSLLRSGTACVVEVEPAWDEDSSYRDRLITVKPLAGKFRGERMKVPRRLLRTR